MKFLRFSILPLLSLLLSACGGGDTFRVIGEVENLGTQNLRVTYRVDGKLRTGIATAVDGKFNFEGSSRDETILNFFTNQNVPIGAIIIRNGETVEAKFDRDDPYTLSLKGNDSSSALASFLSQNAATLSSSDAVGINALVEKFVSRNSSRLVATYVLTNFYRTEGNELRADSILRLISQKVRPSYFVQGWLSMLSVYNDSILANDSIALLTLSDSLTTIPLRSSRPTLFAIISTPGNHLDCDSLTAARFRLVEIFVAPDTTLWKSAIRQLPDSAPAWQHFWLPAGAGAPALRPFSPSTLPFYAVTDSTGAITYRADSISSDILKRLSR